jgi:hypothetical protein
MNKKIILIQLLIIIIQTKNSREAGSSSCMNGLFQSGTCYCYVGYSGSGTCDSGSYSKNFLKNFKKAFESVLYLILSGQ